MAEQDQNAPRPFPGFRSPNYTMVPDEVFDELLPDLTGSELKVLLYIVRRTFGFKRETDTISISQMLDGITCRDGRVLDRGAGVSKRALLPALRSLRAKNIIRAERQSSRERGNEPTLYRLNVIASPLGADTAPSLVQNVHQGVGAKNAPRARGKKCTTQKTVEQKRVEQDIDFEYSNSRKVSTQGEEDSSSPPRTNPEGASGVEAVGEILSRTGPTGRRSKPREETLDEDYQRIQDCIMDRAREFNDTASLKSSTTRAYRLYKRAGVPIEVFIDRIFQARSLTQERTAAITKTAKDPAYGVSRKTKMAYFFAVLEDQMGLAEPRERAQSGETKGTPPANRGGEDEDYSAYVQH